MAVREFQDNAEAAAQGNVTKSIQWSGLRYMLTEVRNKHRGGSGIVT